MQTLMWYVRSYTQIHNTYTPTYVLMHSCLYTFMHTVHTHIVTYAVHKHIDNYIDINYNFVCKLYENIVTF